MKIRCVDLPGPAGEYVAFGDGYGLVELDERAALCVAQDGMLLSLSPEHAERLLANAAAKPSQHQAADAVARRR